MAQEFKPGEIVPQSGIYTITHDPAAVAACDRVIWIEGGQVLADGPAASVLADFTARMAEIGERDADTDLAG